MTAAELDVVGIGNAIVDVLTHADDDFLVSHGLNKGSMTLIDTERAEALYGAMGPAVEVSGGSAANTMAGIASLGGAGGFIGKVRNDQLGGIFAHDIRAGGTTFRAPPATDGPPTARCLIFVTPDALRTMATYLGVSVQFGPQDLDLDLLRSAKVVYLEGYLWDAEPAKKAFLEASKAAHSAQRKVALSLSDPFCVERHRAAFRQLIEGHVDILFGNEAEIVSLFETPDFDSALQQARGHCEVVALTRSEKGSVVLAGDEVHVVDAIPMGPIVDTTGAGDAYAAGFLYGYTRGLSLYRCGELGSLCAGEAISHMGPRPERSLKQLASEKLNLT
ncbi:adenosine kinase [Algihabitans albus]|uniref:adenosine kinase n=1 Tax=Algihabitans albus TaxID=2164067 RepID=UPI000E5C984F|nr:adenosine kinase [Algihabitans albus]